MRSVQKFVSEKSPSLYASLKSLINGSTHRSRRASASIGSYTEFSKRSASKETHTAQSENRMPQYLPSDEMVVPLQPLSITKTVDYFVAQDSKMRESQRTEE